MANYTKTTDFAAKDTLPGGDTNKVVRGSEFETEFDAISTAIATKSDTAGPTFTGTVTIPTVDINAGAIDGTVIGASSAAAGTFTNLVVTSADINGGTVDGATIGGSSAGAGTFTNLTASGTVNFNGATISNLGTITTANLDGGTADNIVIGGSTAAAGTFTTLAATSATVGGAAVLTSVAFSNLEASAVTTSGETFADSDTQIPTNAAVKDHVEAVIPTLSVTESSVTAHQAALAIAATQLTGNITVPDNVRLAPSGTNFTELYGNTNAGAIRFNCESNSHGVTLKGPPHSASATYSLELPNADGSAGQFLKTDGSGKLAFDSVSAGSFTATASGALSNGDTVIINSDGSVTAVGTSDSALNPPTAGTAVEFEAGTTTGPISAVFDSSNNKVVIAYKDGGDSNKGKAIVGTVSGTSISFGTAVEFEAGNTSNISIAFDSNSNKVVIGYRDGGNSNYGTAIVGTVSGTSISFGTAVVFESAAVAYTATVFDSNSNKIVIGYRDGGNSDQATAIVGTVSGTSISFGTAVVFEAGTVDIFGGTFDSSNNKVVFAYKDGGDSNKGKAIVGTVSDTSISFGTAVTFSGTDGVTKVGATFDSSNNKVVIAYNDSTDSNSEAIVGTVSGTSISFGTAVQVSGTNNSSLHRMAFDSNANTVLLAYMEASTEDLEVFVGTVSGTSISFGTSVKAAEHTSSEQYGIAYDSNQKKLVAAYHDDDDSSKGKAVVVSVSESTTNLTPENYVGISNGAYSNSATATIQISGELDDAQSSLTPGQVYYVQGDGSLGLKPDVPAVVAGIAVSATKLMLELSKEPAVTEQNSTAITSSSNAASINLRDSDNFTHTLTENVTYTFSNPAASGRVSAFTLKVIQDSSARTITWPSSVDWAAATAPTLSTGSGNVDVFVFVTYDGGTNYYGFTAGQAMA
tara:strand:- start:1404 stop:4163 length:2760 start_codon:yes stop_codon:yes gene_type:complete